MYDTFSDDYDRFVNWNNRLAGELPFLQKMIGAAARQWRSTRVLDAACGTGMHAIALAKAGYATCGADLSSGMIARARNNAQSAGVDARFTAVGFGGLEGEFGSGQFDAVLCLGNSLPHLLNPQELLAALRDFAACLRPGGLLLIQNRNFDAVMVKRDRWMEPQAHREGEKEWLFVRFYDFTAQGLIQFNILTLTREGQADWRQQLTSTMLYPLVESELFAGLSQAGFTRLEAFGGLGGGAFDKASSGNLVAAAWKMAE